ncbi:type III-A CRISPR-associated RAMP protein Csm3 [Phormidesmis priestleyi]|uniref:type III-A CRISPR-associated RAMP protein Csm3 n=1 Tax=Phormidesmis priestleyi TaxID=268141 RepID=UPI00083B67DC|nr:type III-A CRISPR-associated RAMP protein Csm3 [Phormidesmis priestleyi]
MTVVTRPQKPLAGKIRIESTLLVETGLHIGGGGETLDIGGLDKPVIRDPLTQQPYLPGSSIKGKLRSILERLHNKPVNRKGSRDTYRYESDDVVDGYTEISANQFVAFQGASTCPVSRLFGSTGIKCWIPTSHVTDAVESDTKTPEQTIAEVKHTKVIGRNAPARLIVRDCHLDPHSAEKLKRVDTGLYMTEWKFENGIDRITSAANPRQVERVPAGSAFKFELVYTIENENQVVEDLKNLAIALAILEDDALGGHGSRGYGKIKFQQIQFFYRSLDQYKLIGKKSVDWTTPLATFVDTTALLGGFGSIEQQLPLGGN